MNQLKNIFIGMSIILIMATSCIKTGGQVQFVRIELPSNAGSIAQRASEILSREITERSGAKVSTEDDADFTVELAIELGIGTEGFKIADNGKGSIRISSSDENGLLYGVGKFLHTSIYNQGGFTPSVWRGTSVPKGTMRGIYFATHFNNWYEASSDEELKQYLESIALWGTNSLLAWFSVEEYQNFDDPKAQWMMKKLNRLFYEAKKVGMQVGTITGNFAFKSAPKELSATYNHTVWGNTLCPSKPAAMQLMLSDLNRILDSFPETGLDFIVYWPYDTGGCTCKDCSPWGANGYPKMCKKFTSVARAKFPEAKIILSTWFFDDEKEGKYDEYEGLSKYLNKDKSWVDYLMVDGHDNFPVYPLKFGAPGGLPMVNFPEISMWGLDPIWGGYGANPQPQRFQHLWNQAKDKLFGGFPYSEGIFEDINKTVCSQYYWNPEQSALETVKEYIAYEYSPLVIDSVSKAIELLEQNHSRRMIAQKTSPAQGDWDKPGTYIGGSRIRFINPDWTPLYEAENIVLKQTTEEALRLLQQAETQLTPRAREGWKWRILYLRALIDRELVKTDGWFEGPVLKAAFEELTRIYHSENASRCVHIPRIDDANVKYSGRPDEK